MKSAGVRLSSRFFTGLAAMLSLAGLATSYLSGAHAVPELSLRESVRLLGEVPSGRSFAVTFTVTNTTARPVRILGASSTCTPQGCLKVAERPPNEVPPHGTRGIAVDVTTRGSGSLVGRISLYTDCARKPSVPLEVRAYVVDADPGTASGE